MCSTRHPPDPGAHRRQQPPPRPPSRLLRPRRPVACRARERGAEAGARGGSWRGRRRSARRGTASFARRGPAPRAVVRVAVRGDVAVASRSFGPPGGRSAGCSAGQKQAWILGRRGRTGANQLVPAGRNDPKAYRLRRGALAAGAARPVVGAESFFKSKRAEPLPRVLTSVGHFFRSLFAACQHRGLRRARPPAAVCWLSQALARSCVNTLAKAAWAGSGPETGSLQRCSLRSAAVGLAERPLGRSSCSGAADAPCGGPTLPASGFERPRATLARPKRGGGASRVAAGPAPGARRKARACSCGRRRGGGARGAAAARNVRGAPARSAVTT